ncbi:poly(A) polymerase Cid14 [Coprinopsis sp. MPI-PUGE-AT-0042]|nr:poly(A) polymerase Cid14 [Coprinopsis sp. MPI-PUGE-AT-0042]
MALSVGQMLKENLMNGQPSRTKSYTDYKGLVIPPCGEFALPLGSAMSSPPWKTTKNAEVRELHDDIEKFMDYIRPTRSEALARKDLIARFSALVKRLVPGASVQPVGSSVTGLAFPTSDIDMIATFRSNSTYTFLSSGSAYADLRTLETKIRNSGFASKIVSILNASVPLIRVTDAKTGIEIDLTASDNHGVNATRAVQQHLQGQDAIVIESLVKVLKLFLATRRLGTTYTGGINSYMLTWMVISWVKLEMPKLPSSSSTVTRSSAFDDLISRMGGINLAGSSQRQDSASGFTADLGSALKAFLKFYGEDFPYSSRAIKFSSTKGFYYSTKLYSYSRYTTQDFLLSISDPAATLSTIDLGAKAYAIKHVQATFHEAYQTLSKIEAAAAMPSRNDSRRLQVQGPLGYFLGGDYSRMEAKRRFMIKNLDS